MARRILALSVLGAALAWAPCAHADGRTELEKVRASFLAHNFTDAEDRLRPLLDPKTGLKERSLVSQARMYLGAVLLAEARKDEAKDAFEKLVLDDPSFDPDPLSFPADTINTFIDVRSSLLEQIKTATQTAARLAAERKARDEAEREAQRVWLEKVKAQAAEQKITVRHSRVVASLPFGAGQFQNRQNVLGWIFLGAQTAALAGTLVTFAMYQYARSREEEELPGTFQLARRWHQRADDLRLVNLGFGASFVALAGIGILQAHVAFVPEKAELRQRELPPLDPHPPKASGMLAPIVAVLPGRDGAPGGLFAGVAGAAF